jgi:hypothetical protein
MKDSPLAKFKSNLERHPLLTAVLCFVAGVAVGRLWGLIA